MSADSAATLDVLKNATGKDFDAAYIRSQISAHQKVLETINDKLVPNAKDAGLKAYLEEIRPKIEDHLKQAKQLQQSLDSKNPSSGPGSKPAG